VQVTIPEYKIDNADYLYVQKGVSRVVEDKEPNTGRVWRTACDYTLANAKGGKAAELIRVSQLVQVVPGNEGTALDTVLVKYSLENRGKEKHKIGLRVMTGYFYWRGRWCSLCDSRCERFCDQSA